MTTQSVISIPADDTTFEQNVAILFRGILGDPNTKRVAKSGKNQKGIDVFGRRDRDAKQPVGIQCKLRTTNRKLTETEARVELTKAFAFTPALTEFFIVTTADDDVTYDEIAAKLSQEQAANGRVIDIQIWGWNTLQDRIAEDQKALDAFDPGHSPMAQKLADIGEEQLARSARTHAKLDQSLSVQHQSHVLLQGIAADAAKGQQLLTHWDAQIDTYRDMLNEGRVEIAFELLTKLENSLTSADEPRVRARIRANIGLAHHRLGDEKRAGDCLLEAYAIYPDDDRIATNRILGLQLLERFDESLEVASTRLEKDLEDEHAAGFVFQAAMFLGDQVDPYAIVPASLLKRTLVRTYECHFLRHRDRRDEFIERALQTWQDDPEDADARRLAADALLEKRIGNGQFRQSPLRDPDSREDLETAERLLAEYWEKVRLYDNAQQDPYLTSGCNLVTLHRALHRPDDARKIAIQLLQIAPSDRRVLTVAAHAALDEENMQEAEAHALGLQDSAEKTSLLLHIWSAESEWQKILDYGTGRRREDLEGELLEQFDTMVFRAKFLSEHPVATREDAEELLAAWPGSLPVHIMVADFLSVNAPERFEEVFETAHSLAQKDILYAHRLMFANLCLLNDKWAELIDTLAGYVANEVDTPALTWLAMAYANADRAQGAGAFFRSLPDGIIEKNGYARLAAAAQYNRGDLREAERYARKAIAARPSDLRAHLLLHGALHRRNDMRAARGHIKKLDPSQLEGHVLERLRLAQILRQDIDAEQGLEFGFQMAAHNRDVREVAVSWPGFIFFDRNLPDTIAKIPVARENLWFHLRGIDGDDDVEGILTDKDIPEVRCFSLDHPLAKLVVGKKVGERFSYPQAVGPDREYELVELKHQAIWLLHDIMAIHRHNFGKVVHVVRRHAAQRRGRIDRDDLVERNRGRAEQTDLIGRERRVGADLAVHALDHRAHARLQRLCARDRHGLRSRVEALLGRVALEHRHGARPIEQRGQKRPIALPHELETTFPAGVAVLVEDHRPDERHQVFAELRREARVALLQHIPCEVVALSGDRGIAVRRDGRLALTSRPAFVAAFRPVREQALTVADRLADLRGHAVGLAPQSADEVLRGLAAVHVELVHLLRLLRDLLDGRGNLRTDRLDRELEGEAERIVRRRLEHGDDLVGIDERERAGEDINAAAPGLDRRQLQIHRIDALLREAGPDVASRIIPR